MTTHSTIEEGPRTMHITDLPALGAPLEGGTFTGLITTPEGKHVAVVLLADKPDKRLAWKAAMKWAEDLGATLPSRPVAAMLFANAKTSFEPEWHWTAEPYETDGSYAWFQYFDSGSQSDLHESYEGRARAVRLIQLDA